MDFFSEHSYAVILMCVGFALLAIELFVFAAVPLFFGIGFLVAAFFAFFGLVNDWQSASLTVVISTAISAALLWKPFVKFQDSKIPLDTSSDLIGKVMTAARDIGTNDGAVSYSGTELSARAEGSNESKIVKGDSVKVVRITGTTLHVVKV